MSSEPVITTTRVVLTSPFVQVIEKVVRTPSGGDQIYHCLTQRAYVGVLVVTADGYVPLVRQFRPAVETYTWEFPAGTIDPEETPEQTARREVLEEVGLQIEELCPLGCFHPDTGRLQVESFAFFGRTARKTGGIYAPELDVRFVTLADLRRMICSLEFKHQLHVAIWGAALARNLISLGDAT